MKMRTFNDGGAALDYFHSLVISVFLTTCHFCLCIVKLYTQAPSMLNPLNPCDSKIILLSSNWLQYSENECMPSISLFDFLVSFTNVFPLG